MAKPRMLDGQGKARYRVVMEINCHWAVATLKEARNLARELREKHGNMFFLKVHIENLEPGSWLEGWTRWPRGWKRIEKDSTQ
jgi:hypothetical protein